MHQCSVHTLEFHGKLKRGICKVEHRGVDFWPWCNVQMRPTQHTLGCRVLFIKGACIPFYYPDAGRMKLKTGSLHRRIPTMYKKDATVLLNQTRVGVDNVLIVERPRTLAQLCLAG